jgi:hypothetical protein
MVGFATSTIVFVSKASPLEFSTLTDGTWAKARVEIKSDIATKSVFIVS